MKHRSRHVISIFHGFSITNKQNKGCSQFRCSKALLKANTLEKLLRPYNSWSKFTQIPILKTSKVQFNHLKFKPCKQFWRRNSRKYLVQTKAGSLNKYQDVGFRGGMERPESIDNLIWKKKKKYEKSVTEMGKKWEEPSIDYGVEWRRRRDGRWRRREGVFFLVYGLNGVLQSPHLSGFLFEWNHTPFSTRLNAALLFPWSLWQIINMAWDVINMGISPNTSNFL